MGTVRIVTDREYTDYELLIDYKTVPLADSGIYLKANPQVQIWDYTRKRSLISVPIKAAGDCGTTALAGKDPSELADKPFGEWNSFRIRQIGARTSV